MSLGVYMVGALDPEEAAGVETHLATCPECQAEFDELSGLAALLGRVSEEDIEQVASPPQAVLDRLITASARRHRLNRLFMGLAAGLVTVVLGGTAWLAVGGRTRDASTVAAPASSTMSDNGAASGTSQESPGNEAMLSTPRASASSMLKQDPSGTVPVPDDAGRRAPVTATNGRIHAELSLTPGEEGTTIQIALSGIADGTSCRVTAVATDGTRSPAGSWTVDLAEYHGGPAEFVGHTELTIDRIRSFDIRASTGKRLLSIYLP